MTDVPALAEVRVGAVDADRTETGDHDLPMLRVHRAWEAAEQIAEAAGVDRDVALAIAKRVIGIVGDGTRRWGHLCARCRSLLAWENDRLVCPEHGSAGAFEGAVLLISFDPIGG